MHASQQFRIRRFTHAPDLFINNSDSLKTIGAMYSFFSFSLSYSSSLKTKPYRMQHTIMKALHAYFIKSTIESNARPHSRRLQMNFIFCITLLKNVLNYVAYHKETVRKTSQYLKNLSMRPMGQIDHLRNIF